MDNQFLGGFGGGLGLQAPPQFPPGWQESQQRQMMLEAQRMRMGQMLAQGEAQMQGQGIQLAGRAAGIAAKRYAPNLTSSVMSPLKAAGDYVGGLVDSGTSYVRGLMGPTRAATTTAPSATASVGTTAAGETPGLLSTAGSYVGQALPYVGALYGGYQTAVETGQSVKSNRQLGDALRRDDLTPEEKNRLSVRYGRDARFKSGIGAGSGALSGAAVGSAVAPGVGTVVGAAAGAVLGSIPGKVQEVYNYQHGTPEAQRETEAHYGGDIMTPGFGLMDSFSKGQLSRRLAKVFH